MFSVYHPGVLLLFFIFRSNNLFVNLEAIF